MKLGTLEAPPAPPASVQGKTANLGPSNAVGIRRRASSLPCSVAALAVPAEWQSALEAGIGGMTRLLYTASVDQCASLISRTTEVSVLVAIPEHTKDSLVKDYSAFRANFQQTPFIGLFLANSSDIRALASLAAGGVRHVLMSDQLHNAEHCYAALAASETWSIGLRVWQQSAIVASDAVATLMLAALRLAHEPVPMSRLALAARMHERTLRKYCVRHGLPSPQWLIGWARCLVAAYYLEERGRSIQSIAEIMNYNSSTLLANHLKRYCGQTASDLRRKGPLATASRVFEEYLRSANAANSSDR